MSYAEIYKMVKVNIVRWNATTSTPYFDCVSSEIKTKSKSLISVNNMRFFFSFFFY